jgi:hypothetical protein
MNIPLQTQSFELKQTLTGEDRGVLLAPQLNKRFAPVEALGTLTVFFASDAAGSITGTARWMAAGPRIEAAKCWMF